MNKFAIALCLIMIRTFTIQAEIRPTVFRSGGKAWIQITDDKAIVFSPLVDHSGLQITVPGGSAAITYPLVENQDGVLHLQGGRHNGLTLAETWRSVTPDLLERTVTVTAAADQRYYLDFGWQTSEHGSYFSFLGEETTSKKYSPSCSGPEFGQAGRQTFPFLGFRVADRLYGLIADSPGLWENRCFMEFNLEQKRVSLCNGDGSPKRTILIPYNVDATSVYRAAFSHTDLKCGLTRSPGNSALTDRPSGVQDGVS